MGNQKRAGTGGGTRIRRLRGTPPDGFLRDTNTITVSKSRHLLPDREADNEYPFSPRETDMRFFHVQGQERHSSKDAAPALISSEADPVRVLAAAAAITLTVFCSRTCRSPARHPAPLHKPGEGLLLRSHPFPLSIKPLMWCFHSAPHQRFAQSPGRPLYAITTCTFIFSASFT